MPGMLPLAPLTLSTMSMLDVNLLAKQLLPPNWRVFKWSYVLALLAPLKSINSEFEQFKSDTLMRVNLTAQTIVVEHHIRNITGLTYGVFINQTLIINQFVVNVPIGSIGHQNEIKIFLNKVIPAGRNYTLIFY